MPLPPCFRVNALDASPEALLALLEPWRPVAVPWCAGVFRLTSPAAVDEDGHYPPALAEILFGAQQVGQLCRQETASMLPALALGIEPHHSILDMCAAPGSKTLQLLRLMCKAGDTTPSGLLVANDMKLTRLKKLIDRIRRVPATPLFVTCADARAFPELRWEDGATIRFDRILCDVQCCGDGTVRKARGLLPQWAARTCIKQHGPQLAVLTRGLELLAPGGVLAYSTCTLNPVECEAVVAAALLRSRGSVELVQVIIPGLQLENGITSWRVPSSKRPGVTYASWDEVPDDERIGGSLQRSLFPPRAYALSAEAAVAVADQLPMCGRLLPVHDDGGCFFVTLFRRLREPDRKFTRGESVLVRSAGTQVVYRGKGTSRFLGLARVSHPDGSNYHVPYEDLELVTCSSPGQRKVHPPEGSCGDVGTRPSEAVSVEKPNCSVNVDTKVDGIACMLQLASDMFRAEVASFYGLVADPSGATAAGVDTFPFSALAEGLAAPGSSSLCLASSSLRRVSSGLEPRAAGRAVFFRVDAVGIEHPFRDTTPGKQWPHDAFPWRPTAEAASSLVRWCTRRVVRVPAASMHQLLQQREVCAEDIGVDVSWPSGALLVALPKTEEPVPLGIVVVGLLHEGHFNCSTRVAVTRYFLSLLCTHPF